MKTFEVIGEYIAKAKMIVKAENLDEALKKLEDGSIGPIDLFSVRFVYNGSDMREVVKECDHEFVDIIVGPPTFCRKCGKNDL